MITRRHAQQRGHANHGWLDSRHTFSFADYHDPRWMGFRSLRVLNDDVVLPGRGFGLHPHRDMEIVTYVLSGALEHKDSLGNGRILRAGDVQYMSAGRGVQHSEFNPSADEAVHFLQIWIKPDAHGLAPRYAEMSFAAMAPGTLQLVTSRTGRDGSLAIRQDAELWLAQLEPGQSVTHRLAAGRHGWIQVAEGEVGIDGQTLLTGDGAALDEKAGRVVTLRAATSARVLLFDLA